VLRGDTFVSSSAIAVPGRLLLAAALGLLLGACGGKLDITFVGSPPDTAQGGDGNVVSVTCGDRKVDEGEQCDDGDRADGDGCDGTCNQEAGWTCTGAPSVCVKCGNGNLETGEECDDNNSDNGDGCSADCKIEGACAAPIAIPLKAGKDGLTGSVTSTTSKSDTGQVDAADCGGATVGAGADRVFEFELENPADLDVRVGSNFDTVVRLMTTACDLTTELPGTCADAGAVGDEEAIHLDSAPAGKYYVVVDGKTAQQAGSFSVNVDARCPLDGLKIERVILAEPFRTILFNSNQSCSIDLSRVGTYAQPEAADGPKTFPAVTLEPLKHHILTSQKPPPNGTDYQGDIPFASDGYAGAVYLCRGECQTPKGANVFDAFRWAGENGKPKNAPLQTITFDANAPALNDRVTMSYFRIASKGKAPMFTADDYVGAYWAETFEDGTLSGWDGTVSALHYTTSFNAPKDTLGAFALELDRKDSPPATAWNGPTHVFRDNSGKAVTLHPSYTSIRVRSADKTLNEGWAFWGNHDAETAGWGSFFKDNGQIAFGFYKPVGAEQPNFSQVYAAQTWYTLEYNVTPVSVNTADVVVSINGTAKTAASEKLDGVRSDVTEIILRSLGPKSQVWYDQIIVR
jgi:cysteine-rich repeat protein